MAKIAKIVQNIALTCTALFMLLSCANQLGPQGGEIDKIPPEIVYTFPGNRTINFAEDYIELEFSEYVDKRSVQDAIFISPNIEGAVEYDWSGTALEIIFEDSLRKNITYTVTVGTDVIDLNNRNKMASAYSFTFSTGPEIDYCSVNGKVYDKEPAGTFLFAYQLADTIPNPTTQKPDYVSQAGKDGHFVLLGMAPDAYRIFAIKDYFGDLLYNIGDDEFGCPFKDVILTKEDSLYAGLDFRLTTEDTLEAHINEVTMTDRNHILVEFTEPVDSSRISADSFEIIDSTTILSYDINLVYKGTKRASYFLSFSDSLVEGNNNYLVVKDIYDKSGNFLEQESTSFVVSTKPDTVAPTIKVIETEYPQNSMDFLNPYLKFSFNDGIISDSIRTSVSLSDDAQTELNFELLKIDDASYRLKVLDELKPRSDYFFTLDYSLLPDAAGNRLDTTYNAKLTTINELDFSGLSGNVTNGNSNIIVKIENISLAGISYLQHVDSSNTFNFERIRPGDYLLHCFVDNNDNNIYDTGTINPFSYSEKFVFYPDTLKLAARWPVGDVTVDFKSGN